MKLGIVGCGYMAKEHVRAAAFIDGLDFVAVTGRVATRTECFAIENGIGNSFIDVEDMLGSLHLDGVVVAVPELATMAICSKLSHFQGIILLEKPAGYNLQAAQSIFEIFEAKNNCFVALNRRHYKSVIQANDILNQHADVDIRRVIEVTDQQNYAAAISAGQPKAVVDNWMYANSIHTIDLMHSFCRGQVSKISVSNPWIGPKTEYVSATVGFDSGDIANYQCFWKGPAPWLVNINTNKVRLELRPLETLSKQEENSREIQHVVSENLTGKYKPGLIKQLNELVIQFTAGKSSLVSLKSSLDTMHLISKIYGV